VVRSAFDPFDYCLDFFSLAVQLSQHICECDMCLSHMLNGFISSFILKEDKTESELALRCLDITLTKFDLEEIKNDSKVFLCFLIVVSINSSVAVILD